MAKFEIVSKYAGAGISIPTRATANSAGYDLAAAEDCCILPFSQLIADKFNDFTSAAVSLTEMADLTKKYNVRPTLVSTGVKCKLDPGTYLELSVRSSTPLKYLLVMANSIGIIDGDYYNNPDNEGHIYLQLINLSPVPIMIKKGEKIAQAIIKPYFVTENDTAAGERKGGFGSTNE